MASRALKKEMLGCFVPAFASFSGDTRLSVPQPLSSSAASCFCGAAVLQDRGVSLLAEIACVICTAACEERSGKNRLTVA